MNAVEINVPCAVENLPENIYHADPVQGGSVSYTGMKEILKSPAHYRHYMDTPRTEKPAFDYGHIVHALVWLSMDPGHWQRQAELRKKKAS